MALESIKVINNPAIKTGMGKNGKEWTLMQITTDRNNLATVFAPAAIGDKVEMTWNDQYGNWSAKKVNAQEIAQLEGLRKIYEVVTATYEAVTGSKYGEVPVIKVEPKAEVATNPHPANDEPEMDTRGFDKPINLEDIPFN